MTRTFRFPSIDETTNHPAYPSAVWNLKPDRNGLFPAAKDRGGPVNIAWEIHGTGPTKLLVSDVFFSFLSLYAHR